VQGGPLQPMDYKQKDKCYLSLPLTDLWPTCP